MGLMQSQRAQPFQLSPVSPAAGDVFFFAETIFIGRDSSNGLVVDSHLASRRHAKIEVHNGTLQLVDLGSHNGVFVNGTRVLSAKLHEGDRLYVANNCWRLTIDAAALIEKPANALATSEGSVDIHAERTFSRLENPLIDEELLRRDDEIRELRDMLEEKRVVISERTSAMKAAEQELAKQRSEIEGLRSTLKSANETSKANVPAGLSLEPESKAPAALHLNEQTLRCIDAAGVLFELTPDKRQLVSAQAFQAAIEKFRELVRSAVVEVPALMSFRGLEAVVTFAHTPDGAAAAVSLSERMLQSAARSFDIAVSVGLHAGPGYCSVKNSQTTVLGDIYTVVRGITAFVPTGSVLLSHAFVELLGDAAARRFVARGPHALRGLNTPVSLYSIPSAETI